MCRLGGSMVGKYQAHEGRAMMGEALAAAIQERDEILLAMDVARAKGFITAHGGKVPARSLDWVKVLHLARYEVTSLPEPERRASRLWLAMHGAQEVRSLPLTSPYLLAALDLIFPRDLIDTVMAEREGEVLTPVNGGGGR